MTDIADQASRPSAIRILWQTLCTLFRHLLPLMLVLTLFSIPELVSDALEGLSEDYSRQWLAAHQEAYQNPASVNSDEYLDLLLAESHLSNKVKGLAELANSVSLLGGILTPALLIGMNAVLISSLRGEEFRWRSAFLPFRRLKKALLLELYTRLLMLLWGLPYLILSFFNLYALYLLPLWLIALGLIFYGSLRYLCAPYMLADGKDWDYSTLAGESARLANRHNIGAILVVISPGLVLSIAVLFLQSYVLPLFLPGWAAGLAGALLMLVPTAYLHTAAAAIYVHLRKENSHDPVRHQPHHP